MSTPDPANKPAPPAEATAPITPIRVVIASDVRLYRETLALVIDRAPDCCVLVSCGTAEEFRRLPRSGAIDVLLLDMRMAESRDLCAALRVTTGAPRIVGFAVEETPEDVISCAELGLTAYVPREGTVETLIATVRDAVSGRLACPSHITASLFERLRQLSMPLGLSAGAARLTRREREIVPLLARDLSNKEIAWELHLSSATVKNHIHNIMDKLGVHRRSEVRLHLRSAN